MNRKTILIAVALGLVAGVAGAAYAQASGGQDAKATGFNYELRGNERVEKPDSKTTAADGTVREEFRSGNCVTVKERRPDGAVKTSRKCD